MSTLEQTILDETRQIIEDKGEPCPALTMESEFLTQLPMDSLDLATLIVKLELNTGIDPFRDGFKTFHNIGQLLALYEEASNQC